jgi:hypothetical protein
MTRSLDRCRPASDGIGRSSGAVESARCRLAGPSTRMPFSASRGARPPSRWRVRIGAWRSGTTPISTARRRAPQRLPSGCGGSTRPGRSSRTRRVVPITTGRTHRPGRRSPGIGELRGRSSIRPSPRPPAPGRRGARAPTIRAPHHGRSVNPARWLRLGRGAHHGPRRHPRRSAIRAGRRSSSPRCSSCSCSGRSLRGAPPSDGSQPARGARIQRRSAAATMSAMPVKSTIGHGERSAGS